MTRITAPRAAQHTQPTISEAAAVETRPDQFVLEKDGKWNGKLDSSKAFDAHLKTLPYTQILEVLSKVEQRIHDYNWEVRNNVISAFGVLVSHLNQDDLLSLCNRLIDYIGAGERAQILAVLFKSVEPKNRMPLMFSLEGKLNHFDNNTRQNSSQSIAELSSHLTRPEKLTLALAIGEQGGWEQHAQALAGVCKNMPTPDQFKVACRVVRRLKDPVPLTRERTLNTFFWLKEALTPDARRRVLALLGNQWPKLPHLDTLTFADEGGGETTLPRLARILLPKISASATDFINHAAAPFPPLAFFAAQSPAAPFVRKEMATHDDGSFTVQKNPFPGQEPKLLGRELEVARHIREKGIPLRSLLIEPLGQNGGSILFRTPPGYYRYLSDENVTDDEFDHGLSAAVHDTFTLARHGLYHLVPLKLFHTASDNRDDRHSDDGGRFTWMPDLVWGYRRIPGMGRLDDWLGALLEPNYGVKGLRDLEEIATLEELMKEELRQTAKNRAPELVKLQEQGNALALYDMAILGNHLLAAKLLIGLRLRREALANGYHEFWQRDDLLEPYAAKLHCIFSVGYAAHFDVEENLALKIMANKCDWLQLARQMAFFMTPAHAPFVEEFADVKKFPTKKIYGPHTQIIGREPSTRMGPYRNRSVHPKEGFLGPEGNRNKPSLGPVNGQYPIREFERAAYAVFIPWHQGLRSKPRPVTGARPFPVGAGLPVTARMLGRT